MCAHQAVSAAGPLGQLGVGGGLLSLWGGRSPGCVCAGPSRWDVACEWPMCALLRKVLTGLDRKQWRVKWPRRTSGGGPSLDGP